MRIDEMRKDYEHSSLDRSDLSSDPFEMFMSWWKDAVAQGHPEPNMMSLSTATPDGKPSCRMVLLKGIEDHGFVFYTSYLSKKAREIALNPHASMLFFWFITERQVRIEGTVSKVSEEEATAYFQSRPRGSQIGAWVSQQSHPIASRQELEKKKEEIERRFEGQDILPKPDFWGGYILKPTWFEFWQGRPNRLHDRFSYTRNGRNWAIERLQP